MEVAVACATPRAGFERTLNFLPCPVFFFFFFNLFFPPSSLFLFEIFVDRLSLSLVGAFQQLATIALTMSYRYSAREDRKIV